jgi:murein DD-endopeptidase MepM/ murein hydrolase activator NlpD
MSRTPFLFLIAAVVLAGQHAVAQPAPGELTLPVEPACISSAFGWRHAVGPHAPAGFHNGVDIPAPAGAYVHAAAAGRVAQVKRMGMGGLQVIVQHVRPDGTRYMTLYAHLGSVVPALAEGKWVVAAGEKLGRIGRTGVTYGTHVFFEILVDGKPVDPEPILGVPRCGQKVPEAAR